MGFSVRYSGRCCHRVASRELRFASKDPSHVGPAGFWQMRRRLWRDTEQAWPACPRRYLVTNSIKSAAKPCHSSDGVSEALDRICQRKYCRFGRLKSRKATLRGRSAFAKADVQLFRSVHALEDSDSPLLEASSYIADSIWCSTNVRKNSAFMNTSWSTGTSRVRRP